MTGHPIPGGPSTIVRSKLRFLASFLASPRTMLTSLPEFSSAIPSLAWTMGPRRVSETNHSPLSAGANSIAFSVQNQTHTPQPSQLIGATRKVFEIRSSGGPSLWMASKRQTSLHLPQAVQWPANDSGAGSAGKLTAADDFRLKQKMQIGGVHVAVRQYGFPCQDRK